MGGPRALPVRAFLSARGLLTLVLASAVPVAVLAASTDSDTDTASGRCGSRTTTATVTRLPHLPVDEWHRRWALLWLAAAVPVFKKCL